MYYIAKSLEFIGLSIILFGFLKKLPNLMSLYDIIYGVVFFTVGWIIEKYTLK